MKTFLRIIKLLGIIGNSIRHWLAIVLLIIQISAAMTAQPEPPPGWANALHVLAMMTASAQ